MFIITAKCSKRRVVKILLIFALLLSLFLALRACRHSSPPVSYTHLTLPTKLEV